jgi:predicted amidohydrolase
VSPRIAVVQFQITHLDCEKNLKRIEDFVKRAAEESAQVVVFPEDCVTGSIFGDLSKLDTTGAVRAAFQELAKKYHVDIVTGSSMEGTPEGNFNTSYYIDAKGDVLGTYRKNHLYPSEYKFLKPGTDALVFETAYGRAGIVICWDMLFPEIFQRLKSQGVQLIYCPSYWYREIAGSMASLNPSSEENHLDALCIARALEANAAIIYTNAACVQTYVDGTKDTLIGHSQITMPVLGPIKKVNSNDEVIFVESIDTSLLERSASIYQG